MRRNESAPRARAAFALALLAAGPLAAPVAGCAGEPTSAPDASGVDRADSICGSTNDAQFVNEYDGTLGPPVAFVQARKGPVGAMEATGADDSTKFCSGTLVADDLFLTAGHCVDAGTVGQFVAFNYERAAGGASLAAQSHVRITEVVEDELGGLDYAVVRLEGKPGLTFGVAKLGAVDPPANAPLVVIGHPNGEPKQLAVGSVARINGSRISYADLDTLGRSSGSGILGTQGTLVGVHTSGGCSATGGANSGMRISRIREVSRVLALPTNGGAGAGGAGANAAGAGGAGGVGSNAAGAGAGGATTVETAGVGGAPGAGGATNGGAGGATGEGGGVAGEGGGAAGASGAAPSPRGRSAATAPLACRAARPRGPAELGRMERKNLQILSTDHRRGRPARAGGSARLAPGRAQARGATRRQGLTLGANVQGPTRGPRPL